MGSLLLGKQIYNPNSEPLDVKSVASSVNDFEGDAYEGLIFYDQSDKKVKVVTSSPNGDVAATSTMLSDTTKASTSSLGGIKATNVFTVNAYIDKCA